MEKKDGKVRISEEWERRDKIRTEAQAQWEEFDIETSLIFYELGKNWGKYDKNFLAREVNVAIQSMHRHKDIMTYFNDGSEYNKGKLYKCSDIYRQYDKFPIPLEYVGGRHNGDYYVVAMDEICVVTREYEEFDILFAVQYSLTPVNKCENFLKYHLKKSFNNNYAEFEEFMNNSCLEYKELLANKHEPFYKRFVEKLVASKEQQTGDKVELKSPDIQKLKWLGAPSQFSYILLELAKKGYIEIPATKGEASYSRYAKVCWGLFEFQTPTTLENWVKEMNPNKNTLSDAVRAKFSFPLLDEIGKIRKKQ